MNQTAILEWLPQLQRIGVALVIGFVPALIARWKRRPMTPWYLYGFVCALLAWPAVAPPAIHALLVRPHGKPEQISQQRRRVSALALLKEESVRSYPSWIAELKGKSPAGIELRRHVYEHLEPGEALVLFRERAEPGDKHAVSYRHGDVHLGYVPGRHRWIADAIDDGLRLFAIVETVKTGWIFPPARNIRPHADCRSPELPLVSIAARHTNGALYAINSQRRARAELVAQRQREAEVLTGLKTE